MLNEEKTKLMTRMAMFQQDNPEKFKMNDYYRHDYIGIKFLGNLIWFTICYALILVVIAFVRLDSIMEKINIDWIIKNGTIIVIIYAAIIAASALIGHFVYGKAHKRAKAQVREYYAGLKKLERINRSEETVTNIQKNFEEE